MVVVPLRAMLLKNVWLRERLGLVLLLNVPRHLSGLLISKLVKLTASEFQLKIYMVSVKVVKQLDQSKPQVRLL